MNLEGVITPLMVPIGEDENPDLASLERFVDYQLESGIHGIFVLGSAGEGNFWVNSQKKMILDCVAKKVDSKISFLCGISDTSLPKVLENIDFLKDYPIDAFVTTMPFYTKLNEKEQHYFIKGILEASSKPLVLYNITSFVPTQISVDVIKDLLSYENLVGVKESTADVIRFRELAALKKIRQNFALFVGNPRLIDVAYGFGFDGAVLGQANFLSQQAVEMYEAWKKGAIPRAKEIQDGILDILRDFDRLNGGKSYSSFPLIKRILKEMGIFRTDNLVYPYLPGDFEKKGLDDLVKKIKAHL